MDCLTGTGQNALMLTGAWETPAAGRTARTGDSPPGVPCMRRSRGTDITCLMLMIPVPGRAAMIAAAWELAGFGPAFGSGGQASGTTGSRGLTPVSPAWIRWRPSKDMRRHSIRRLGLCRRAEPVPRRFSCYITSEVSLGRPERVAVVPALEGLTAAVPGHVACGGHACQRVPGSRPLQWAGRVPRPQGSPRGRRRLGGEKPRSQRALAAAGPAQCRRATL